MNTTVSLSRSENQKPGNHIQGDRQQQKTAAGLSTLF